MIREHAGSKRSAASLAAALTDFDALDAWLPQAPAGTIPPIPFTGPPAPVLGFLGNGEE
jgi:hypothetical protein